MGIVGQLIGTYNSFISVGEAIDQYFEEEYEKEYQEFSDGGVYGWSSHVKEMFRNISEKLKKLDEMIQNGLEKF